MRKPVAAMCPAFCSQRRIAPIGCCGAEVRCGDLWQPAGAARRGDPAACGDTHAGGDPGACGDTHAGGDPRAAPAHTVSSPLAHDIGTQVASAVRKGRFV